MSMHADEESDEGIVPMKRSNNEGVSSAETVEGRTSPEGNGGETAAARTLRRGTASNGLIAVRRATRLSKSVRFTALLHHITTDLLKQSYLSLERDSSPGIDGVTWQAYGDNLEGKLKELHDKVHRGSYRAHPARRTYIPKADGSQRPLSISSNRRPRRFSRPSTRRTSSGSPTDSGRDAASTMRWTPQCRHFQEAGELGARRNTVHFSRILIDCLMFTGGSGLSDLRRSGKLLIFRLTPRLLRRWVRGGKRSWRISLSTASCQTSLW